MDKDAYEYMNKIENQIEGLNKRIDKLEDIVGTHNIYREEQKERTTDLENRIQKIEDALAGELDE